MRIGMILECGPVRPDGTGAPDVKVYEFLARQLLPNVEIQSRTLNSKPGLIRDCGITSKLLLDVNRCDRVIIIWDLQPPWKGKKGKACRKEDCDAIRESLDRAGLTAQQLQCVHLVCMEHELETLLLADERAIATYLSQKKAQRCRIKRFRNLAVYTNPKGELQRIFQEHVGRDYIDWQDAIRIIQLADIKEIGRCDSLKRFAVKVAGERIATQIMGIRQ